jgi:hypothetical protein
MIVMSGSAEGIIAMEERTYRGNIDINALADHLVATFNQGDDIVAQRAGQGDQVTVQVGRVKFWTGNLRSALGISISKLPDGVHVATGQSNWLELNDPSVGGMLLGALFFPPLIVFPLMRGIRNYTLYQEIWTVIDDYCTQDNGVQEHARSTDAVYCQNCGGINDESAKQCHLCGMPLYNPEYPDEETPYTQATGNTVVYKPRLVTCPRCDALVPAGKYCNNCASVLPTN